MMRTFKYVALNLSLCTAAACAQVALAQAPTADATTASSTSPVTLVYVAFTPKNSNGNEIAEYSVAANGALTPLPGSPYSGNVTSMAVSGNYLFGPNKSAPYIETYAINSSGELHWVAEANYLKTAPNCGSAGPVFLDRTGKSLYLTDIEGDCSNNYYESFAVDASNGHLTYLNSAEGGAPSFDGIYLAGTVTANDQYIYTMSPCSMYYGGWAFKRASNGSLTTIGDYTTANGPFQITMPSAPSGGLYCPYQAAADPTTHVAMPIQLSVNGATQGNPQLASFTEASNGDLSSTNTSSNMPSVSVTTPAAVSMAPSGQLVAVGGIGGLQVFHFNGASAPTTFTPLLTTATINYAYWDNSNHLFAISQTANKLYVFTVTPTGYSAAPGSPYTVADPQALTVNVEAGGAECSAPTSAGVNLCSPATGASVASPVQVLASANVTGTLSQMQLWVDGVKKFTESSSTTLQTSISLAAGTHRFAVLAINTSGQKWEQAVNATVQ
ncbi:MAG TPA: Ig-like domain-containing protein [Acidobacteriaceae bacterium]|nr:Ig-like domain-containing protein [Acidobacteriaceae bacterium]